MFVDPANFPNIVHAVITGATAIATATAKKSINRATRARVARGITDRISNYHPPHHPNDRVAVSYQHDPVLIAVDTQRPTTGDPSAMKLILTIAFTLAALATVLVLFVYLTRQSTPEPIKPPQESETFTCIQAARSNGMTPDKIKLIVKAQQKNITTTEAIKIREDLRRREIDKCDSVYQYLLRR